MDIRRRPYPRAFRAGLWAIAASSAPALAQDGGFPHERASIYLGLFITDRETSTRFDSDAGPGTDIDMENDLGLESSMNVARFGGAYWFKPRQRLDLSLFDLSRSSSRQIQETIDFGDATFAVDTTVQSEFDYEIVKADYTFAALDRANGYLGVTGGLYIASFKLAISEASLGTAESEELTAPLPVLGLRGEYRVTDRISVNGVAQWFSLETDDAGGSLTDFYVGAEYRVGRRMDVGLAYNKVTMRIEAKEPGGLDGQLDWSYDGWVVYAQANFGRGD
jgi:hypothetical protein